MRAAAVLALGLVLSALGCGSNDAASTAQGGPRPGSLEALWKRSGEDVGLVMGTSDYAPGPVRVSFLVLTHRARPIERPTARVWLSRGLEQAPFQTGTARLEDVGKGQRLYVTHLDVPGPGTYWLLAEPVGGTRVQGVGNVVVGDRAKSPAVGDRAFPSKTPTLADAPADEPWVFLVGPDGRIEAKFEGAVSEREFEAAVRRFLT